MSKGSIWCLSRGKARVQGVKIRNFQGWIAEKIIYPRYPPPPMNGFSFWKSPFQGYLKGIFAYILDSECRMLISFQFQIFIAFDMIGLVSLLPFLFEVDNVLIRKLSQNIHKFTTASVIDNFYISHIFMNYLKHILY